MWKAGRAPMHGVLVAWEPRGDAAPQAERLCYMIGQPEDDSQALVPNGEQLVERHSVPSCVAGDCRKRVVTFQSHLR